MNRFLKSGNGWRIGWNPEARLYKGLVGSDDWAIELTADEFNDFCRLLNQLVTTMQQMEEQLMDEEKITCEAESELLWLEVTGYPHSYDLRLILNQERCAEGNWANGVAKELLAAIQNINLW